MPEASGAPRLIHFGVFEIDLRAGELRRQGLKIKLQEKPFQVLALLLEHPGEVVTREEFRRRLWSPDTFVEFDHSLSTAVKKLREALGDDAGNPRFVETVPLRGYRFIAPVDDVDNPTTQAAAPSAVSPKPAAYQRYVLPVTVGVGLVVVTALLLDVNHVRDRLLGRHNRIKIQSLAVLPLENLSGNPAEDYFSDGMTDALINGLGKSSGLRVISRTSMMRYKGTKKPVQDIARELHVDAVLEGTVLRVGGRVRLAANLIQASPERHLWAQSYERDLRDVLALQSEMARAIAQEIQVKLTPQEQGRLSMARPVNPEAYEAFLKGHYHLEKRTLPEFHKGLTYFEEAVRKDPTFALAYVGVAEVYGILGEYRWIPPQEARSQAGAAVSKALELDDTLAEAHVSLGHLIFLFDWNWTAAEAEFKRAIELNPNLDVAHAGYALFLASMRRMNEALPELARARELSPLSRFADNPGVFYQERRFDKLLEASQRLIEFNPDDWVLHLWVGFAHQGQGRIREAIREYERAVEMSRGDSDALAALAHAYAASGKRAQAQKILKDMEKQARTKYVSPYMLATIYAGLGEKDKAFEMLERAYQEKSSDIPWFIRSDPRIDNLRSDPHFTDVLRRIGLPP